MNRRAFLANFIGASGLGYLLTSAWASPSSTLVLPLLVTVGHFCADAKNFRKGSPPATIAVSSHDPAELLEVVRLAIDSARPIRLGGLGTQAHYFTLSTQLSDYGYRPAYVGHHRYRATELEHTLQGDLTFLSVLAERLRVSGQDWAKTLGYALPEVPMGSTALFPPPVVLAHSAPLPSGSKGHLVSWVFTPKGSA